MTSYAVTVVLESDDGTLVQTQLCKTLDGAKRLHDEIIRDYNRWRKDESPFTPYDAPDFVYEEGYIYGFWEDFIEVAMYQKI